MSDRLQSMVIWREPAQVDRICVRRLFALAACVLCPIVVPSTAAGQTIAPAFSNDFSIAQIGVDISGGKVAAANFQPGISQIAFAPGDNEHIYISTFVDGIWRYDYSPTGNLSNGILAVPASIANINSPTLFGDANNGNGGALGIAFHQDATLGVVMYLAPSVSFFSGSPSSVASLGLQSIYRLTDAGGNGVFGDDVNDVKQAIVNNVQTNTHHQINQLQIYGNSLYAGIGSRTSDGGTITPNPGEVAYTGTVSFIEDLTLLASDTSTVNLAGFIVNDPKTDTQPFTSTDASKLRVYATGARNPYGIEIDDGGNVWASVNKQAPPAGVEDQVFKLAFQDDMGHPKQNDVIGDWRVNGDATTAGYFHGTLTPDSEVGPSASANGFAFVPHNIARQDLRGHILIARTGNGDDIRIVDPDTGAHELFASGNLREVIEVDRDPFGNILIGIGPRGQGANIYRISALSVVTLVGDYDHNGVLNAADWSFFRGHWGEAAADLNSDLTTDERDFTLFKHSYLEVYGEAAFRTLLSERVPEPSMITLCALALFSGFLGRHFRRRWRPGALL